MNAELLTAVLRRNGHLTDAEVVDARLTDLNTNGIASTFQRAELTYSAYDDDLPQRLVIKRPLLGDRGRGEADVYERVLHGATGLPLLTCFGVLDEGPDRPLALLFEDLCESHTQTQWPIVPSLARCTEAVVALARVHSHWWGRADVIDLVPPVAAHQNVGHLASFLGPFVDSIGEYLTADRIVVYERVFARLDALLEDRLGRHNSTLLHTDPHYWNFLYPQEGQPGRCVIFDWPLWRTGLAGTDLAYMIALHLYAGHRRRFEPLLLNRYLDTLRAGGVACTREDLELDYRIGVIVGLLMPVMEFSWKIGPHDWLPKLHKALCAFDDLDCAELLG